MAARYSDTLREIKCVQDCIDRGLLAAIEGAQPSGIGKKLTQKGFEMIQSLEDETLSKYDLAMMIVNSVLKHIKKCPVDITVFKNVLLKSGYSRCEKFAAEISEYMDSARRGPRKSSLTQSRSSVSRRSATRPSIVRSDSEPPVNQLNQSGSGSLVKRRTLSESAKSSGACAKSTSSGSTVKPRSTYSFSKTRSRKPGGELSVKQLQTQSASSGPHAKSGSGLSVNRQTQLNSTETSSVNRQTQSTSTGTRSRSSSGEIHAKVTSGSSRSSNGEIHATQVDGEGSGATCGRQVVVLVDGVRFATEKKQRSYKMNDNGSHGTALIMNNIEWLQDKEGRPLMSTRHGAKEDAEALKRSLQTIGYTVVLRENLTGDGMERELTEVRDKHVNIRDDSFICCILSHGGSYGVFGVDKKCVPINHFSKILEPDVCPQLMHKPKIFFIQACRGREVSVPIDGGTSTSEEIMPRVPRGADFYLSYATDPGHVALRSWYPQLLSEALLERSAELSLDEIVTEIHYKLADQVVGVKTWTCEIKEHLQIGQVVHSMRKAVYFK